MAIAKKFDRAVTVTIPAVTKVTQVPHIELNLTMEEAETLFNIMHCIGGDPFKSPRKDANAIFKALIGAGVNNPEHEMTGASRIFYQNKVEF